MLYDLPDGTVIEWTIADTYGGPGNCFSRQNVNTNAIFWRVPQKTTWAHTNWRSQVRFYDWLKCCETLSDFLEGEREAEQR